MSAARWWVLGLRVPNRTCCAVHMLRCGSLRKSSRASSTLRLPGRLRVLWRLASGPLAAVLFGTLMLGAGCAGGRTSMAIAPPLGGTVTAVEVTESGRARGLPEAGIAEVDVNSVVHLEMNRDEIARAMAALVDVDDREAAALARRAGLLDQVTRA